MINNFGNMQIWNIYNITIFKEFDPPKLPFHQRNSCWIEFQIFKKYYFLCILYSISTQAQLHVSFECKIANGRNLMQIPKHSFPPISPPCFHQDFENLKIHGSLEEILEYLAIAVICCDIWEKYLNENCGICPLGAGRYLQINSPLSTFAGI